jgi:hypothetical protein
MVRLTTIPGCRRIYRVSNDISQQTKLISKTIKSTLKHCVPGLTFRETIRLTADNATSIESITNTIQTNPVYSSFFKALDILASRIATWEEEEKENPKKDHVLLERSVQLLNRSVTRNVIGALQLNRLRDAGLPRTKTDKLILAPREQLRYALLAEDDCLERELPGSELAFLAGYHYDVLLALYTTHKAPKEISTTLEKSWAEGLKAARLAATLASHFTAFHHHSYIYGASLVAPIGKVLMAELFPKELLASSWSQFIIQCEKFENRSQLALWVGEFRRFGMTYAELSGFVISFLTLFEPIESAVFFHSDPQNLIKKDTELYRLSALISVSLALGSLKVEKNRVSYLNSIHLDCLKDLGIPLKDVDELVEKASE